MSTTPGYVYFILDNVSNAIKIGYTSKSPKSRVKQLQTGNSNILYLLKYIPGTKHTESLYHKALYKYTTDTNSEWFKLCDDVIYFCQLKPELENIYHILHNTWSVSDNLTYFNKLITNTSDSITNTDVHKSQDLDVFLYM